MNLNLVDILGGTIGDTFAKVVGTFKLSPQAKAEMEQQISEHKFDLEKLHTEIEEKAQDRANQLALAQIEVNKTEAAGLGYKSAWRPTVGYICCLGLFYQLFLQPILAWVSGIGQWSVPPTLDISTMIELLGGMLGIGGLRTVEKLKDKD